MLGLMQRRILFDLVKVTLLTVVGVSMLLMMVSAMVEASRRGLDPMQVLMLMPYLIPPTLPYTLPTCLLFACTFVYGGLAGRNEIVALKSGGIHPLRVVQPAVLLAVAAAVAGVFMADRFVPYCNRTVTALIFDDLESLMYGHLRQTGQLVEKGFPYQIFVKSVRDRELIEPVIKHIRDRDEVDLVVTADTGRITVNMDPEAGERRLQLTLDAAHVAHKGGATVYSDRKTEQMPLPQQMHAPEEKVQALDFAGCRLRHRELQVELARCELDVAGNALDSLAAGDCFELSRGMNHYTFETVRAARRTRESLAEVHIRIAQAASTIPFVLLGVPISILFRRRDFLQTFFVCFLPIILLFYPSMILAFNVYKEGQANLFLTVWGPTALLALASIPLTRRVMRY